jgi:DNA-binding transcriptional ArsR family regulator
LEDHLPTKRSQAEIGPRQVAMKAMSHPCRVHALHILSKQPVASPKELAFQTGVELGTMAYHIRELRRFGYIELVETKPRRGATEHYYRAVKRAHFDEGEWLSVPPQIREEIMGMHLTATGKIVSAALSAGTFEGRANRHCSLLEFDVDETGFEEVGDVMDEAMEKLMEIRATNAERLLEDEAEPIPVATSMLGFERAPKG